MPIRFADARGTEWEVWEVSARPILADAPPLRTYGRHRGEPSWLHFESATQRRHLTRYPQRWEAMLPNDLMALCDAASLEPPHRVLSVGRDMSAR